MFCEARFVKLVLSPAETFLHGCVEPEVAQPLMPAITLGGLLALKYWILLLAYVPWSSQPNSKVKYYFSNRVQCQIILSMVWILNCR
jgi:hypothetical protein